MALVRRVALSQRNDVREHLPKRRHQCLQSQAAHLPWWEGFLLLVFQVSKEMLCADLMRDQNVKHTPNYLNFLSLSGFKQVTRQQLPNQDSGQHPLP